MRWIEIIRPMRGAAFAFALIATVASAAAQTDAPATSPPPAVSPPAAATPAPSTPPVTPAAPAPATASPTPNATAPASTEPAKPDSTVGASPGDTSISQALDVPPRPAVIISGSASWDEGFKTLKDAFAKLNDALGKNNLTASSHPLAVFTSTDDAGFKYSAMIPIGKAPEGKTELTPEVKLGETPAGKAIRFQHRASYDDIDSTYEAITAYLDEKGLESKNMFAEEYMKDMTTPDDPKLEVDIYVFLK